LAFTEDGWSRRNEYMRNGLTLITIWEDPAVKRLLSKAAKKDGRPLSTIIRGLYRDWLEEELNVKVPYDIVTKEKERRDDG
jgi:hypothetical protein